MNKKQKERLNKILWFFIISIVVLFFEAAIYYQIKLQIPDETISLLGIPLDLLVIVWGMTVIMLAVVWYLLGINDKRRL